MIPPNVYSTPDGGAVVDLNPKPPALNVENLPPNVNLATVLDEHVLDQIGGYLLNAIQDDDESRREWVNKLSEGIDLLGINENTTTSKIFDEASGIFSPTLLTQIILFTSIAPSELLPPEGPAGFKLSDPTNENDLKAAQRIQRYFNIFLTEIAEEYYPECENSYFWLAFYGSVFKKTFFDPILKRPTSQFIFPQDFIVNNGITSLQSASRMTQKLKLTEKQLRMRELTGVYRYVDIPLATYASSTDNGERINQKIAKTEGRSTEESIYNAFYNLYECHCDIEIPGQTEILQNGQKVSVPKPYVVTLCQTTGKILSMYQNWTPRDKEFKRIETFTHLQFCPGIGLYGLGLLHMAGGLAQASTDLTRLLINSTMLANAPCGLRAKGMHFTDSTFRIAPFEFPEIDTLSMPIRDVVMPLPFKDASPVTLELKNQIEKAIETFSGVANQQFPDYNPNAPVGTTLALMEEKGKLQSSIMRRLHRSMGQEFKIFYNLFAEHYATSLYPFPVGEDSSQIRMGEDFSRNIKIIPVSDPSVSSLAQNMVRNEAVLKIGQQFPHLHNMHEILKRIYEGMKIPEIQKILPDPPKPQPLPALDPVSENMHVMNGKPIQAYIWQDHQAHKIVHESIKAQLGNDPQKAHQLGALLAHIAEHDAFHYQIQIQQQMHQQLPPEIEKLPPQQQNQIAMMEAHAVQQMQQQQQKNAQPQITPEMLMLKDLEIKQQTLEQKMEQMKINYEIDMRKLEFEKEKLLRNNDIKISELEIKTDNEASKLQTERYKARLDNL